MTLWQRKDKEDNWCSTDWSMDDQNGSPERRQMKIKVRQGKVRKMRIVQPAVEYLSGTALAYFVRV